MDIRTVQSFFLWSTVVNGGLLFLSFALFSLAPDALYRMQRRWFPLSRDAFCVVYYSFLGLYKIFFLVFNLVPYVALVIVRS